MGCSVRFANPGCTEERRIERLSGRRAPHSAKTKEKPAGVNRRGLLSNTIFASSANGRVGALYLLSKEKPAGMNRRAVSSAIGQKDSRYRDFYLGRIVNVNRLPERNRYRHTE